MDILFDTEGDPLVDEPIPYLLVDGTNMMKMFPVCEAEAARYKVRVYGVGSGPAEEPYDYTEYVQISSKDPSILRMNVRRDHLDELIYLLTFAKGDK